MNLNAYANGLTQTVNPNSPLLVRVATGVERDASHRPSPTYDSPCSFTASISGSTMTVTAQAAGTIMPGQTVLGASVVEGTYVVAEGEDDGTYVVSVEQGIASEAMTAELLVVGNAQPVVGWKDIQQLDALNVQGTRYKIYLYGRVEAIVRTTNQGGDLIVDPATGRVYLVAMVFEHWPPIGTPQWCAVAATLQNGG